MICPNCLTDLDAMHDCRDETLERLAVERDDWKRRAEDLEARLCSFYGPYSTVDSALSAMRSERDRLAELLVKRENQAREFMELARLSLDNFKADIENHPMPHSCGQLIGRLRNVLKEEK